MPFAEILEITKIVGQNDVVSDSLERGESTGVFFFIVVPAFGAGGRRIVVDDAAGVVR